MTTKATLLTTNQDQASAGLVVEPIDNAQDVSKGCEIVRNTFGRQTHDGVWIAFNPGWDTPEGAVAGDSRNVERWSSTTRDRNGNANTVYLKATLPDPQQEGERVVVGLAIWVQLSMVGGYGDVPAEDLSKVMDLEARYPGNEAEQRYICQLDRSLHGPRIKAIKEKATSSLPAAMVLDLCVVDPNFQRRGIAKQLVQWGLDEAQRRGGLEALTEASSMGRHVYLQLGFHQDGPEIEYAVDDEFAARDLPSNIFMRTGSS
ncbi:hypothetical protein G7046_g8988 [Stylonectria norvegica]|nr:hypothetical protein G7046_g8988 [Stylonectria norvegica]